VLTTGQQDQLVYLYTEVARNFGGDASASSDHQQAARKRRRMLSIASIMSAGTTTSIINSYRSRRGHLVTRSRAEVREGFTWRATILLRVCRPFCAHRGAIARPHRHPTTDGELVGGIGGET